RVWLISTGWSGGAHRVGKRIKLGHTPAILDAIHAGALAGARTPHHPLLGFEGVPGWPRRPPRKLSAPRTPAGKGAHADAAAKKLARLFIDNFKKYESGASPEVRAASPMV